jgi:hypothetical protein
MAWASAGAWNSPRSGGWQSGALSPRLFAFDFLANSTLPAEISLSRATTGTRFNSSGNLATEAINAARFDYIFNGSIWVPIGLRSEEQRTNILLSSGNLSNATVWSNSFTSITSGMSDPFGGTSAVTIDSGTGGAGQVLYQGSDVAGIHVTAGATYAAFCWMRKGSTGSPSSFGRLTSNNARAWNTGVSQQFALTTSWQRMVMVGVVSNTIEINMGIDTRDVSGATDASITGTIDASGFQVELGSFATSYIPTTTTALTRSPDLLSSNAPLTGYLAAGPSILEATDIQTGTTSRTAYAAGAFTWPQNQLYRLLAVYKPGTNTSGFMTVGGPY